MIICDLPRFLFVHIPKTAGVSISQALREGNTKHPLCVKTKHETAQAFIARNGLKEFDSRHSFSVVRNPLQRFLSQYAFMKKVGPKFPQFAALNSPDDFVDAIERDDKNIIIRIEQILPQHAYLTNEGAICVNDILRHENVAAEFASICEKIGLSARALPHANKAIEPLPEPSERVKSFVSSYYAQDYELFGY